MDWSDSTYLLNNKNHVLQLYLPIERVLYIAFTPSKELITKKSELNTIYS